MKFFKGFLILFLLLTNAFANGSNPCEKNLKKNLPPLSPLAQNRLSKLIELFSKADLVLEKNQIDTSLAKEIRSAAAHLNNSLQKKDVPPPEFYQAKAKADRLSGWKPNSPAFTQSIENTLWEITPSPITEIKTVYHSQEQISEQNNNNYSYITQIDHTTMNQILTLNGETKETLFLHLFRLKVLTDERTGFLENHGVEVKTSNGIQIAMSGLLKMGNQRKIWAMKDRIQEMVQKAILSTGEGNTPENQKTVWLVFVSRSTPTNPVTAEEDMIFNASDESDDLVLINTLLNASNTKNFPLDQFETFLKPHRPHIVASVKDGSQKFSR